MFVCGPRQVGKTTGDDDVDKDLRYLHARFPAAEAWQVSLHGKKDFVTPDGIRVTPAVTLLLQLV